MITKRRGILWLGKNATPEISLQIDTLDLTLRYIDEDKNLESSEFATSCSLVIDVSDKGKLRFFYTKIKSLIIPALNHGLIVIINCAIDDFLSINEKIESEHLYLKDPKNANDIIRVKVIINDVAQPSQITKFIMCHLDKVGPSYDELCKVVPIGFKNDELDEDKILFLKRAFEGYEIIRLRKLTLGFSAKVFCVYATFQNEQPMPFVAKFDTREKILIELDRYRYDVLPTVPFNLRPNIDERRCVIGAHMGLLVGNFVENSELMWDLIITGNSRQAISSLFDNTLRAWRHPIHPNKNVGTLLKNKLDDINKSKTKGLPLLNARYQSAKTYSKSITPPLDLIALLENFKGIEFIETRIHGDLHTENIQVRNGESIIIDFTKVNWGPSSIDSAALEVWIAFYKWPTTSSFKSWKLMIDELYIFTNKSILLPRIKHEPDNNVAIWNCIRQIRALAFPLQLDNKYREYQGCLAYWMYMFATYELDITPKRGKKIKKIEEQRRVYAYYLASKLANNI